MLTNLTPNLKLIENDTAFINNENYFLQDMPKQFIGASAIIVGNLYKEKEIKFCVNLPSIINIGKLSYYTYSLNKEFENLHIEISLLVLQIN